MATKTQHYVPRFYLRNFADSNEFVYSYRLDLKIKYGKDIIKHLSINGNNICCELGLYEINGIRENYIENIYGYFENDFALSFRLALDGLRNDDKPLFCHKLYDLLCFALMQYRRGRNFKEYCENRNVEYVFPFASLYIGLSSVKYIFENYTLADIIVYKGSDIWVTDTPVSIGRRGDMKHLEIGFPLSTDYYLCISLVHSSVAESVKCNMYFRDLPEDKLTFFAGTIVGRSFSPHTRLIIKEKPFTELDKLIINTTIQKIVEMGDDKYL